jgi:hypothetical protein
MAVIFGINRQHQSFDSTTFSEFCTATLSGTYVNPGGFTWNPFTVYAGKGSSPLPSSTLLTADFYSPTGHTYVTTVSGTTATTKIFAGTTELANGTAVPNATVPVVLRKRKI